MPIRIAINGFGRIGRSIVRAIYESHLHEDLQVVAINEIAPIEQMAHLLKYDSIVGRFNQSVSIKKEDNQSLIMIHEDRIAIFNQPSVTELPWKELKIDIVLECSGTNSNKDAIQEHIKAGAKKVLLSQPGDRHFDETIVYGFNHQNLLPSHQIVSNASCTSNCLVPVLNIINQNNNIVCGASNTIHAAMSDQPVNDGYAPKLRLTRSAMASMIPVTTHLSTAVEKFFPQLSGNFSSTAIRVPTINVSMIEVTLMLNDATDVETINQQIVNFVKNHPYPIVHYCHEPLVSIDFNHIAYSAVVDLTQTRMAGSHFLKLSLWFDNEWGFANRMLDTTRYWFQLNE